MLTTEDIEKLTKYQKEVFATKEDISDVQESISKLQTSVDGFAKSKKTKDEDNLILNKRMKDAEEWIDKASPKLGLEFKH